MTDSSVTASARLGEPSGVARSDYETGETTSLFAHEAEALAAIRRHVKTHGLGEAVSNLDVHDSQSNRYFETDLLIVARFGVYVVELKHWSGRIAVRPNSWIQNDSFFKSDPHKANNFKAKLLKGLYERRFPQLPHVYFESVVVLTNEEVEASGCAMPTSDAHNPTFESIERFFQYLKNQRQSKGIILTEQQTRAFADYLLKLKTTAPPRDFVFPGYEIVERLYQYNDRAEVVARRTDTRYRRLTRLRIFYPPQGDEVERLRARERATATLNAVEKIGDHPNILRVWDVPNDNNYVVEGSEWSEAGTLRDVLDITKPLPLARALAIAVGLVRGLQAAYKEFVVHRAVSPANVLMVGDVPKLMNFDLSFQLDDNRVTVIPDATKLKRSPYFAPEVYLGSTPEMTADLFSLGVVLYEMLAGETPFECSTDIERLNGELGETHRAKLIRQTVPERVINLVFSLVRQNPSRRPSDAQKILSALEGEQETGKVRSEAIDARLPVDAECGVYSVQEFVCAGTTAQIYRATGVRGRQVAIKLFNHDVPLQKVVDEQTFAAATHHSSLVRVDSYNQWSDGRYYIAFDWISERSWRQEIRQGGRPNVETFVRAAKQLLEALTALHENTDDGQASPILHNDIKPDNILIGSGARPVLIDFGSASHPHVATYEGTEGYVAPDLRLGGDRKYSVDGDLYALSVTLYEWLVGRHPNEGAGTHSASVTAQLLGWLRRGSATDSENRFQTTREMSDALVAALARAEPRMPEPVLVPGEIAPSTTEIDRPAELAVISCGQQSDVDPNPFVPYLNSLHSRSAGSENALAEAQARNPLFSYIQVSHPLADIIREGLQGSERRHVILTGHAGDGKSTIAVEVFKRLSGLPFGQPLARPLQRREDLPPGGERISIIKDFSEWSSSDRALLTAQMLEPSEPRFLLISNTGTLLDTFKSHEAAKGGDWVGVESSLLAAMNEAAPKQFEFHGSRFVVINVAMADNLGIAEKIFERIIDPARWETCSSSDCRKSCPIFRNVLLIRDNLPVVRKRLFLAYRRMYEYGTRLTLRQLCAHMAYMVTAGLEHEDIVKMAQRANPPAMTEFMFFNRFFGDNGCEPDLQAAQLRAVRAIREQGFGLQPCPTWERQLWLRSKGKTFELAAVRLPDDFETLRQCGAGLLADELLPPEMARAQVRRAVFFLHDFNGNDGDNFQRSFLRSSMLLDFIRWQEGHEECLSLDETNTLKRRILHVLQEHFTGVRLPEGSSAEHHLVITLSRHSLDVRQSAQVVLARYARDDFQVRLVTSRSVGGGARRELVLDVSTGHGGLRLALSLPFLDYVMLRSRGEIGRALQASYIDRLERFKGLLIRNAGTRETDDIMLVRLRTNHTFRRQIFAVRNGRLEVTDV